jgi:tetratricopeptide (TPR) repeat protein
LKYLVLNIDLEYIRAVVSTPGGKFHWVKTEDNGSINCFWLYFFIDQFNKRIKYRKSYRQKVLDKSPGYISYSFPKERDFETEKILFDNHNYSLTELLEKTGIISSLRSDFDSQSLEIPTYIIYSNSISSKNKEILNQYFINQGFNIISYALPIAELYCYKYKQTFKCNAFSNIVFIEALNKDLNLSYLSYIDNAYVSSGEGQKLLENRGGDPRERTLVEYVVSELSRETNFLNTKERRQSEIKRLSKNAYSWLNRLNCVENLILDDITLAISPNTKYRIRVSKKSVEELTGIYIRDLLAEFRQFVNDNNKDKNKYSVVLLGEALNNEFIKKRFIEEVGEDCLYVGDAAQLDEVFADYKDAFEYFQKTINQAEIKNRYNAAIYEGDKFLKENNYEQAKSSYLKAKNLLNSDEIKTKIEYINELINNEVKKLEDFNLLKQEAKKLIDKGDFQTSIEKIDDALELFPDNEELSRKRNTISLQIQVEEQKAKNLYKDAQNLFKDKKYAEAKEILETVLKINPNTSDAKSLAKECEKRISLDKTLKKGNSHYIKLEFDIARMTYKKGLPDTVCENLIAKCNSLIPLFENLSVVLLKTSDSLNNENLELTSIHLQKCEEYISQIKSIDGNLNINDLESEYNNYKKRYTEKQRDTYQYLIKQADKFYKAEDFNKAEELYNNVLKLFSNDEYCVGKINEISSAKETLAEKKKRYDDLLLQGSQHLKDENFFGAEQCFKDAIKCLPNENKAKNILDEISFKLMELNNTYISYLKNGKTNYEKSEYEKAITYFERAHEIKPHEKEPKDLIKECNFKIKFSGLQQKEGKEPTGESAKTWDFDKKSKVRGKGKVIKETRKKSDDPFDFEKPDEKKSKNPKYEDDASWNFSKNKQHKNHKKDDKNFDF